mgnify:CR=1 FL=1
MTMLKIPILIAISCLLLNACTTTNPLEDQIPATQIKYYNPNCARAAVPAINDPKDSFGHLIYEDPLCKNY